MTFPRLRWSYTLTLLPVLLLVTATVWAADYVDVPLGGQTLARLRDPGKFPTLADRAAKVQEALTQVLGTQDTAHPSVLAKQESGIWSVSAGPVRVLSVLPKDASGAGLSAKELAESWAAMLKKLLPLATPHPQVGGTPPKPSGTATTTPAVGPPATTPAPLPAPPATTLPAKPVAAAPVQSAMTRTAAAVLVLDAMNAARALPEDQYLSKRDKLAGDLLTKLNAFFTGQPLPMMPSPTSPATMPPITTTPPPATATLRPAAPSAITVPADWAKLTPEQRLKNKFELARAPYTALAGTDPQRYQEAGNLLAAARAAKAASNWEQAEGYLDSALTLMGVELPPAPPAAGH